MAARPRLIKMEAVNANPHPLYQTASVNARRRFFSRLLLAYVAIPLLVPAMLTLSISRNDGGSRLDLHRYITSLPLIGTITFAAMVVLGLPLLLIYFRLKQRSMLAFALGGGLCAVITAAVLSGASQQAIQVLYYGLIGVISGLVFRIILLGARGRPADQVS